MTARPPLGKPRYALDPEIASFEPHQFRPKRDYCLVLFDFIRDARVETRSAGGIIIAGEAKQPEREQAVLAACIAAGPGYYTSRGAFVANEVKAGDRVVIAHQLCGDQLVIGELEYRVVRGVDVLGVGE